MIIGGTYKYQVTPGDKGRIELDEKTNHVTLTITANSGAPVVEIFIPAEIAKKWFEDGAAVAGGGGRILTATSLPAGHT